MDYGVSLAFTFRRLRSILCVGYHAHRCCFRSGRLCLAKACCLACWQGNLPDYDILVKCVLREANCVSCARVMARGAVSRLASVKGSSPGSTEHRHAFFLPQTPRAPLRAAFAFLPSHLFVLRAVVVPSPFPKPQDSKPQRHNGTKKRIDMNCCTGLNKVGRRSRHAPPCRPPQCRSSLDPIQLQTFQRPPHS